MLRTVWLVGRCCDPFSGRCSAFFGQVFGIFRSGVRIFFGQLFDIFRSGFRHFSDRFRHFRSGVSHFSVRCLAFFGQVFSS